MADIEIKTEGVGSLLRALNKVDRELRTEVRSELVGLASLVATDAATIAQGKGLRKTGDLIAHIRPGFRGSYAYVADTARHGGYNYPARLEYEKRGKRSFLRPAVEKARVAAAAGFEWMLDRLVNNNF